MLVFVQVWVKNPNLFHHFFFSLKSPYSASKWSRQVLQYKRAALYILFSYLLFTWAEKCVRESPKTCDKISVFNVHKAQDYEQTLNLRALAPQLQKKIRATLFEQKCANNLTNISRKIIRMLKAPVMFQKLIGFFPSTPFWEER